MQIHCRACNARVVAEDIDLPQRMAKCRKCHAVFSIAEILAAEGIGVPDARPKPIQPNPPEYAVVEEWGSDLSVWYRWIEWSVLFLVFFCIAWDSFIFPLYAHMIWSLMNGQPVPWLMVVFPLGHLAVGIGLTYSVLCTLLNITWIQLMAGILTVRHGPIPVWGNQVLDTKDVDQFFITDGTGWRQKGRASYCLSALLKDGTRVELVTHSDSDLLLWLEHKLEEKLKIQDRAVPGEIEW